MPPPAEAISWKVIPRPRGRWIATSCSAARSSPRKSCRPLNSGWWSPWTTASTSKEVWWTGSMRTTHCVRATLLMGSTFVTTMVGRMAKNEPSRPQVQANPRTKTPDSSHHQGPILVHQIGVGDDGQQDENVPSPAREGDVEEKREE